MSNKNNLEKYFGEIMRELFSVWTPRYYRVNISNARTVLEELQTYINTALEDNYLKQDHIMVLIEEYLYRSKRDIIFKSFENHFWDFELFLNDFISKKHKQEDFLDFTKHLSLRLAPIIRTLNKSYFSICCNQLKTILLKNEDSIAPRDFTLIKKISCSFSTEILGVWYSKYYIYDNINALLIWWKEIEKFIWLFDNKVKEYEIYLKIFSKNKEIIEIFKIHYWSENIFNSFPSDVDDDFIAKRVEKNNLHKFLSTWVANTWSFWVKANEKGIDYIWAMKKLINKTHILLDEIKFEYIYDNISIFSHSLVICQSWDKFFPYCNDSIHVHRKWSSIDFFKSKNEKIQKIYQSDIIDDKTQQKVQTIFRFYKYFLNSDTIEHKFLNLWIWWEHIFSLDLWKEKHTWSNIQLYYPYIDSLFYSESILRDLLQVQCQRSKSYSEFNLLIWDDHELMVTNLYKIIKEKWDDWDKLLKIKSIRDNDLVKVKLFRFHEKLKSPKAFIVNNNNKIKWNLYRLYRVRNSIVHKWNTESMWLPLEMLTLDLESYYTNLLDIILYRFSIDDRFENIEQLFVAWEKTYQYLHNEKWLSSMTDTQEIKKKIINPKLIF